MQARPEGRSGLATAQARWRFGSFMLSEADRRIERDGQPVRLGPRSFELLLQLVRRAGEFLSKHELLSTVWSDVVVEEGSVRVHMSALRKALGEPRESDEVGEWISSVPLRGYRFNGRVRRESIDFSGSAAIQHRASEFTPVPLRLNPLVGRHDDVEGVLAALDSNRLITIVGTGGIGKTSVAIRAAERRHAQDGAEVAFVDLSPLTSGDHALGSLARAVGIAADSPEPLQAIAERLRGRRALVVIDNCEHVIDALALPCSTLLGTLPDLQVLATSREALKVPGEVVFRLSPLAVPHDEQTTLEGALAWPSVRLLVDRALAGGAAAFDDSHAPSLARISRQLDGIPLAIELVAPQLGLQSAANLAARLESRMRSASPSIRSAHPRHRSLAAALDWSLALLNEEERRLLRRLSVFRGRFDTESALGISSDVEPDTAFDALTSLAGRSLVCFDGDDAVAPYRLLETTRSYASDLLEQSGERPSLHKHFALLVLDAMKAATAELRVLSEEAWGRRHAFRLDDVRLALDICMDERQEIGLAAELISASGPLWFHLSEVAEYRDRIAAAIALTQQATDVAVATATSLNTLLVTALLHTGGSEEALEQACNLALQGALASRDPGLELRARWARSAHDMFRGEYGAALKESETLLAFARTLRDASASSLAYRVSAMANHFCGRFASSRQFSEAAIASSDATLRTHAALVGPDTIVAAQAVLCRTLWIQGDAKQAMQVASAAVSRAESLRHSVSLCSALYGACPVALWCHEWETARRWVGMMANEATTRGLRGWQRYADWFSEGLRLGIEEDRASVIVDVATRLCGFDVPKKEMLLTFCEEWLDDEVVRRAGEQDLWCAAEVYRAQGWRHQQHGRLGEAAASFRAAADLAKRQGALGWQARADCSLSLLSSGS